MRFFSYHTDKSIEQAKDAPRFISFAVHSRELYLCQRPSENAGSERTTIICSNNGVEPQNNACMKGFARLCFSASRQQNAHKKQVWQNGAWVVLRMPLTHMASLVSSDQPKRNEKIITALFRSPCVN